MSPDLLPHVPARSPKIAQWKFIFLNHSLHIARRYLDSSEYATIDTPSPRFTFLPNVAVGQTVKSYQVQVGPASSVPSGSGLFWDSGEVESNSTIAIAYPSSALSPSLHSTLRGNLDATPLPADTDAAFRARVRQSDGTMSDWSQPFSFRVGLLQSGDWSNAAWIGCDQSGEMENTAAARNRFRTEVSLPSAAQAAGGIKRAVMYMASTGNGRAWVNGALVGPESWRLQASWTGFRQRVLYWASDVTSAVATSTASVTVGLELGNGWADVLPAPWNGTVSKGAVPWKRGGA